MMSGGTMRHNQIALNLRDALRGRLAGRACRAYVSDVKVVTPRGDSMYPDVVLICPPPPAKATFTEAPLLVAEVLSESSEKDDQSRKRWAYCTIPSLRHYLLVDQVAPRVEVVSRETDGTWRSVVVEGLEQAIELRELGTAIPLAAIFDEVELPPYHPLGAVSRDG